MHQYKGESGPNVKIRHDENGATIHDNLRQFTTNSRQPTNPQNKVNKTTFCAFIHQDNTIKERF